MTLMDAFGIFILVTGLIMGLIVSISGIIIIREWLYG